MSLLYRASVGQATLEGVLVVAVFFPLHFLSERPQPSVISNLVILLVFFGPPVWTAMRLRASPRPAPWPVLEYALFGFQLGLWGGIVGGLEHVLLKVVGDEPFLVPLTTWVMIACIFAGASATAYAVFVPILRAILALVQDATAPITLIFRGSVTPDTPSLRRAILYSIIPGIGHYHLRRSERGAVYLSIACSLALLGLFTGTAAVVLLVEGRVMPTPYLIAAALLILSPVCLAIASAVDVYMTSQPALGGPPTG